MPCVNPFITAADKGDLEAIKALMHGPYAKNNREWALARAAERGHLNVVKALLPFSNPRADYSQALKWASTRGHLDIVELLIPASNVKAKNSLALAMAAENGHTEVVDALLPFSNPMSGKCLALRHALKGGYRHIIEKLCNVSDVEEIFKYTVENSNFEWADFLSHRISEHTLQSIKENQLRYLPQAKSRLLSVTLKREISNEEERAGGKAVKHRM